MRLWGSRPTSLPVPRAALLTLSLLVASSFVMVLNETVITVALPVLVAELRVSVATAQWLSSGFLLTMAVVVPMTGYLLQRFTARQSYVAATTLFTVGTVVCALAPGFPFLLAGRVVQAAGTAIMIPLLMTTTLALVLTVASYLALFSAVILLPFYVQEVLGRSSLVAGMIVVPGSVAMGMLSMPVGRAYDRFGVRRLVIPASMILCVSLWAFAAVGPSTPMWLVVVLHVLLSIGLAMKFTPLVTDALSALPRPLHSHGSAIMTTCQQLAGAIGTALFVTVMMVWSSRSGEPDIAGVRTAFAVAAAISTIVLASSLHLRARPASLDARRVEDAAESPMRSSNTA